MTDPLVRGPKIQGWCPSAHRPMMSGDGLVVRVRPRLARLTAAQVTGLCEVAERFGNGTIDLTNRANLQVRGVAETDHQPLLEELATLDLLDVEPGIESKRNILVPPLYRDGDLTTRLTNELIARLGELPDIPAKFGFAVDIGPTRLLTIDSADIRLERGNDGLVLRADGLPTGRQVTEEDAIDHLIDLTHWFCKNYSMDTRRMARLVKVQPLPQDWQGTAPGPVGVPLEPGVASVGAVYGAPFGALPARALQDLMKTSRASALRVTPWRLFLLEVGAVVPTDAFVTASVDPLLTTDSCPGAPYCPQAEVETRHIARTLAPKVAGSLHVSGCAKGCARQRPANLTLVGRNGRFDLVKQGCAGDVPFLTGLRPDQLMSMDLT